MCKSPNASAEATARALGLTQATGLINVLDAGYANKSVSGKSRENGYEVALELPLFDWGKARTAKAETSTCARSITPPTSRSGPARRCAKPIPHTALRTIWRSHYRDEVVPLRKKISDEVLLRYNGMLASVFELLSDAREQINSVNTAIEVQRDYWLAETDLQAAINGNGGASTQLRAPVSGETAVHAH